MNDNEFLIKFECAEPEIIFRRGRTSKQTIGCTDVYTIYYSNERTIISLLRVQGYSRYLEAFHGKNPFLLKIVKTKSWEPQVEHIKVKEVDIYTMGFHIVEEYKGADKAIIDYFLNKVL